MHDNPGAGKLAKAIRVLQIRGANRALGPISAVTFPERRGRSMRCVGELQPPPRPAALVGSGESG